MKGSETFDLENFPVSESALNMLSYVSDGFYDRSYVGKWLFQVMGMEYDDARRRVEGLPWQLFPETATWGLMYHEIKWGLPVREDLSEEERRRRICRKRDDRAPMTPYCMENYLGNATGFEVHVSDIHDPWKGYAPEHPNQFRVFFIGDGTLDAGAALRAIRRIKQSHTVFEAYEYIGDRFLLKVTGAAGLVMRGDFYPRSNLPLNRLDGATRLDGRYPLSGYLSGQSLDFYPLALQVAGKIFWRPAGTCGEAGDTAALLLQLLSRARQPLDTGVGFGVRGGAALTLRPTGQLYLFGAARASTETDTAVKVRGGAAEVVSNRARLAVKGEACAGSLPTAAARVSGSAGNAGAAKAEVGLIVEKAWGTLNGSRQLDGSRKLDAARYAAEL